MDVRVDKPRHECAVADVDDVGSERHRHIVGGPHLLDALVLDDDVGARNDLPGPVDELGRFDDARFAHAGYSFATPRRYTRCSAA